MNTKQYLLLGIHVLIGIIVAKMGLAAKVYAWSLITLVFFAVIVARSWKDLVFLTAYVTGAEVFTRMSHGLYFYESHKYLVMLLFLGIIFRTGIRKPAIPYVFYLLLLIPGILYTMYVESADPSYISIHIRKAILFNIAGPVALGLGAIALAKMPFRMEDYKNLLFYLLLPIINTVVYIILYTPSLKDIVFTTSANFATSGGFGPNQVATILGLGMFASFVLFLLSPKTIDKVIFLAIFVLTTYRSFLTFSRGGTLTGIFMIFIFIFISSRSRYQFLKSKNIFAILTTILVIGISYYYLIDLTEGMLYNRYAGLTTTGQKKEDITSGRVKIFLAEIQDFIDNPFLGSGVGRAKIERAKKIGFIGASHNEISRLLAEHGIFGLIALLILILAPLSLGLVKPDNLFFYPFYAFWFLTIFHSAMRLAAPAVMYAFALLWLIHDEESIYYRYPKIR